ncbi:uncharacterized protein HMPREF1541_07506 [Cyphellophora europaea CBS 101466]|uniref:Uncharacterized protein n=1 Tax=Cyphellophora europaea (strain CBS 101466) TaxID=1220924 RepID=W2RQB8_CYPE1|nr:uncharacterized protein HMPREF1541_07506 [Cyphellophora europaea CBS 101466]ETN37883.1 hypothetical protein HMPREF1541_07506 [Cyphellophora europaea CBS 101466]
MSLAASPVPTQELTEAQQARVEQLDEDIAKARAEIASLTSHNSMLTGALLSSANVQSQLRQHLKSENDAELAKLLDNRDQYGDTNVHRMAYGVTTFPFTDPAPESPSRSLLGIRFDIHKRGGTFESPYYILCRSTGEEARDLAVHRHTLPGFIPLLEYQEKFLGVQDEGYGSADTSADSSEAGPQDLEGLVKRVRADLVAWRLRQDAVQNIQEKLAIQSNDVDLGEPASALGVLTEAGDCGISSFHALGEDAHYARIVWSNGRVGRIKIGNALSIDRAVVFGNIDGDNQRCSDYEQALVGDLDGLISRLRALSDRELQQTGHW